MTALLLVGLALAAPEASPDSEAAPQTEAVAERASEYATRQAWDALVDLPPEARQALVQRLLDRGLIEPPLLAAGHRADRRALAQTVEERLAAGRTALRAGDPAEAVAVLGPVRGDPRVAPFWQEAVDAHVYEQRELAGRWFGHAGQLQGTQRLRALRQARDILTGLVTDFPDSVYAEPVLDALARVDRALDAHTRP